MKVADKFVKLTSVMNIPGNPTTELWVNSREISYFGNSPVDFTKIGASSVVYMFNGSLLYCVESPDEIYTTLQRVEVET